MISLTVCAAEGRLPPPRVPMDRLLAQAGVIVVGRIQPGSADPRGAYVLVVGKVIKGQVAGRTLSVRFAPTFPAAAFPPMDDLPAQLLLTGWDHHGHVSKERRGLDLCAEQVWLLEGKAVFSAGSISSVQPGRFAPLVELLAQGASAKEVRAAINRHLGGRIPAIAVESFTGRDDPGAGALAWDAMLQGTVPERIAFRTIHSLGAEEALKYCRKVLRKGSEAMRLYALEGMMKYGDAESVPAIVAFLAPGGMQHPQRAIEALGVIGDPRAVGPLIEVMDRPDPPRVPTTCLWEYAREALQKITHVWLSPNDGRAAAWWKRNQAEPAGYWLRQGIEQWLYTLQRYRRQNFVAEYLPRTYLERATCRRLPLPGAPAGPASDARLARAWKAWWQKNRLVPQEAWVMESFRDAGRPIHGLRGEQLVEALLGVLNTKPSSPAGPGITDLHQLWADRLLTRVTGLRVADPEYAHYTGPGVDWKAVGPQWKHVWADRRERIELRPLRIRKPGKFKFHDADRRLLLSDFDAWEARASFKPPLVRRAVPGLAGRYILAEVEITLTNRTERPVKISAAPWLSGVAGYEYGSGGSLSADRFECISHTGDFATVGPGESIRWSLTERAHYWGRDDKTWLMFRLIFRRGGEDPKAWRGVVRTPWISIAKKGIVEK